MPEVSRDILARLPKVDLHRHLEGSVRPATIADICRSRRVVLPTYDARELADLVRLSKPASDLEGFFIPFRTIKFCFTDKEALARLAYEAVEDASLDNIEYLELRFSPEFMAFQHRLSLTDVMDGVTEGVELASRDFATVTGLIVSISRHLSKETMQMPWPSPDDIAQLAIDYAGRGVVGLDLSGRESGYPPELFKASFEKARCAGLGITVHAGEDAGPESIHGAIEHLGAQRVGHGVRAVRDPDTVSMVKDRGVALEVCATSNVLTNAVESIDEHPVRQLFDAGVCVTINTDDPTVCGVTLTDEYVLLAERFGFTLSEIKQLIENARRSAFAKP